MSVESQTKTEEASDPAQGSLMLETRRKAEATMAGFEHGHEEHTSRTPMNEMMRRCCRRDVAGVVSM